MKKLLAVMLAVTIALMGFGSIAAAKHAGYNPATVAAAAEVAVPVAENKIVRYTYARNLVRTRKKIYANNVLPMGLLFGVIAASIALSIIMLVLLVAVGHIAQPNTITMIGALNLRDKFAAAKAANAEKTTNQVVSVPDNKSTKSLNIDRALRGIISLDAMKVAGKMKAMRIERVAIQKHEQLKRSTMSWTKMQNICANEIHQSNNGSTIHGTRFVRKQSGIITKIIAQKILAGEIGKIILNTDLETVKVDPVWAAENSRMPIMQALEANKMGMIHDEITSIKFEESITPEARYQIEKKLFEEGIDVSIPIFGQDLKIVAHKTVREFFCAETANNGKLQKLILASKPIVNLSWDLVGKRIHISRKWAEVKIGKAECAVKLGKFYAYVANLFFEGYEAQPATADNTMVLDDEHIIALVAEVLISNIKNGTINLPKAIDIIRELKGMFDGSSWAFTSTMPIGSNKGRSMDGTLKTNVYNFGGNFDFVETLNHFGVKFDHNSDIFGRIWASNPTEGQMDAHNIKYVMCTSALKASGAIVNNGITAEHFFSKVCKCYDVVYFTQPRNHFQGADGFICKKPSELSDQQLMQWALTHKEGRTLLKKYSRFYRAAKKNPALWGGMYASALAANPKLILIQEIFGKIVSTAMSDYNRRCSGYILTEDAHCTLAADLLAACQFMAGQRITGGMNIDTIFFPCSAPGMKTFVRDPAQFRSATAKVNAVPNWPEESWQHVDFKTGFVAVAQPQTQEFRNYVDTVRNAAGADPIDWANVDWDIPVMNCDLFIMEYDLDTDTGRTENNGIILRKTLENIIETPYGYMIEDPEESGVKSTNFINADDTSKSIRRMKEAGDKLGKPGQFLFWHAVHYVMKWGNRILTHEEWVKIGMLATVMYQVLTDASKHGIDVMNADWALMVDYFFMKEGPTSKLNKKQPRHKRFSKKGTKEHRVNLGEEIFGVAVNIDNNAAMNDKFDDINNNSSQFIDCIPDMLETPAMPQRNGAGANIMGHMNEEAQGIVRSLFDWRYGHDWMYDMPIFMMNGQKKSLAKCIQEMFLAISNAGEVDTDDDDDDAYNARIASKEIRQDAVLKFMIQIDNLDDKTKTACLNWLLVYCFGMHNNEKVKAYMRSVAAGKTPDREFPLVFSTGTRIHDQAWPVWCAVRDQQNHGNMATWHNPMTGVDEPKQNCRYLEEVWQICSIMTNSDGKSWLLSNLETNANCIELEEAKAERLAAEAELYAQNDDE